MVGYFNAEEGRSHHEQMIRGVECAMGPLIPGLDPHSATAGDRTQEPPVKRVVCSPDLPVFSLTQVFEEAAVESSNTAAASAASATSAETFQCSMCNKSFAQKNTYQNHLRSHGKEGDDPYQCNICGKTFAVPARLTRHYRTHTGEKPYQCEYCNKSFSVKENLSVHRRIHTKERPYKCDICDRAFEHSGKLHRHMRIHTGERPHKCAICNKTFIQSGQLVIHMRTHTGEKPYVCKVCGKGFTCSKQLKVHTRTHTGEKPYTCDICGKSFGYNHVLKLHQVAHYGEKVYKCTICNETFTSKKTMEVHIKSHSEPTAAAVTVVIRSPPRIGGGGGQQTPDSGESSCASSTSDKENKADSDTEPRVPPIASCIRSNSSSDSDHGEVRASSMSPPPALNRCYSSPPRTSQQPHPNMRELCYYLYPRAASPPSSPYQPQQQQSHPPRSTGGGVNPALLAAAAAAAASEGRNMSPLPRMDHEEQDAVTYRPRRHHSRHHVTDSNDVSRRSPGRDSSPVSMADVVEPSVYLCPDPLGSMQRRTTPSYHFQIPPAEYLEQQPILINLPAYCGGSSGGRRRSHQPELQSPPVPMSSIPLTPPHSNPVSPVPSSSPDPIDLAIVTREPISLPPRKRSKIILKAMETAAESEMASVRYSSVIHYAKAS